MAKIRPFAGIRPEKGKAAEIAALPYDVYSREEAARVVAENPSSFLKIDRPETQFAPGEDMYGRQVYQKAHDLLWSLVADGTFLVEKKKCYYIYELTMCGRVQTGIVACASVDDYRNGVIRKHENTRAEKEEDRIRHVDACEAQTGPIFLAYRARPEISAITEREKKRDPAYDFVSEDGIRHRVFVIDSDGDIAALTRAFAETGTVYIADGHHRAASAVKVAEMRRRQNPDFTGEEEFNYFLSVLFPDDELMILDYNRVVRDLNGCTEEEFLDEVRRRFAVTRLSGDAAGMGPGAVLRAGEMRRTADEEAAKGGEWMRPKERGSISMYLGGRWYLLKIRPEDRNSSDPVAGMDVSILQEKLLGPVLSIGDPRTDRRIDFVGGIRGMEELVRRCNTDCAVAFAMYPTSIGELFAVADAGRLMPPKSTWFEPKLRSGLFVHAISCENERC